MVNSQRVKHIISMLALAGLFSVLWPAVQVAEAQTFRYPEDTRPASLMPFFAEDMSSVRMVELIFDSLVFQNKRGDFEGGLATSWTVDPDKLGIRFELRKDVTWHDGKPFTSDDIVFTVAAAKDQKTIFTSKSKFNFINEVEADGPHAVTFAFDRPINEAQRRFLFKIIPKHKFKSTRISRKDKFGRNPVGTGPFKVNRFRLREVRLEANPDYWEPAMISSVVMQHTPDKSAQVSLLQYSGGQAGVQAVIFLPPKNIPIFENSESVSLEPYHTVSWWYLAYNHKNKALKDPVVREAMALALDRQELLEAHLGRGDVLSGPFTESSPFYDFDVSVRERDIEKANKLLDDAGYKLKKGVRKKKGKTLKFTFVLDKELAEQQALFLGMQAQLKKVGINVKAKYRNHAAYKEEVYRKKKFDLTMNVWSFREVEDIYPLFHSKGSQNFIGYSNPDVDQLLENAAATKDYKQLKSFNKQLHQVLNRELPYFFLWSLDIYSGISRRVGNVYIAPYYYFTSFKEWELTP